MAGTGKFGRFTEEEIKKQCPPKEDIKKYFNKDTVQARKWFFSFNIRLLHYLIYKIFEIGYVDNISKNDSVEILVNEKIRPKFMDVFHPKNKKYMTEEALENITASTRGTLRGQKIKSFQQIAYTRNLPIRQCGKNCDMTARCQYFINNKTVDGDLCIQDVDTIEKWIDAFKNKKPDKLVDDAGMIMGLMEMQLIQMVNEVRNDGVMLTKVKTDNFGNPLYDRTSGNLITEKEPNPLLNMILKIVQTMKINLPEFLMSPKSKGDPGDVGGNIKPKEKMNFDDLVKEQREGHKKLADAFQKAAKLKKRDFPDDEDDRGGSDFISKSDFSKLPSGLRDVLIKDKIGDE